MPSITAKITVLGYDNAYHLLRRSTYKITKSLINQYAAYTPQQALTELFNFDPTTTVRPLDRDGLTVVTTKTHPTSEVEGSPIQDLIHYWLHEAHHTSSLQYKIGYFLHTCFIVDYQTTTRTYDYMTLLNHHTKGKIKDLAKRVTKNDSMLIYLDNRYNTASNPNENYGREFLELFTILKGEQIGPGNYTNYQESDVTTAAKVFTGFTRPTGERLDTFDPATLIPEGRIIVSNHDTSDKTFSSAFAGATITGGTDEASIQLEMESFVDMVFGQFATAQSYARRLYRYFLYREITPDVETSIITPLAQTLYDNDYDIELATTQLLTSMHFYDEDDAIIGDNNIGAVIKSPIDLTLQLYSLFEISLPDYVSETNSSYLFYRTRVDVLAKDTGFTLFKPIDVNGYPPYSEGPSYDKLWISANNLRLRYSIISALLNGYNAGGFPIRLDSPIFVRDSGNFTDPGNALILLQEFFDLLFVSTPTGGRYTLFYDALLDGLSETNWFFEWQRFIDDNAIDPVRIGLDRLITKMVSSIEFQVM